MLVHDRTKSKLHCGEVRISSSLSAQLIRANLLGVRKEAYYVDYEGIVHNDPEGSTAKEDVLCGPGMVPDSIFYLYSDLMMVTDVG